MIQSMPSTLLVTSELSTIIPSALSSGTIVKIFHWSLPAILVSLCACTVAPSPTAPSAVVTADSIAASDGFEPGFYRAFVQNAYEAPDRLEPIRILRGPLRIYLRTEDDADRKSVV